jgi:hypothetical protein
MEKKYEFLVDGWVRLFAHFSKDYLGERELVKIEEINEEYYLVFSSKTSKVQLEDLRWYELDGSDKQVSFPNGNLVIKGRVDGRWKRGDGVDTSDALYMFRGHTDRM